MQNLATTVAEAATTTPVWTPERTARALRLWRAGISALVIAERLGGVSRCAVLSKIHRHKAVTGRSPPAPLYPAQTESPVRKIRRDIHRSLVRAADEEGAPPPRPPRVAIDPAAFAPLPDSRPRPWASRRPGECAWPIEMPGAGETPFSCCQPVAIDRHYCLPHYRKSLHPNPPGAAALKAEAEQLMAWLTRRGG